MTEPANPEPAASEFVENAPASAGLTGRLASGGLAKPAMAAVAVVLVAVVGMQVLRADEAKSQTALPAAPERPALARVNGQPIRYEQVADECVARYGREVLDNLIHRKLIEQACAEKNVSVSGAEIAKEAADQAEKFNLPLDTWYQMLLSERKLTRAQYHRDVLWPMLALRKLAGGQVTVSEDDMQQAFERDYGPRVKARMIVIDGNQRQASKIWELAKANPDDFEKIAAEHSADPNSRPLGGIIPPIRRHAGSPQLEKEAFGLAAGEISGLVQMADGKWVFLKCEGRTQPVVQEIQDVWTELLAQQKEEKVQAGVAQVFDEIRSEAKIINHLTGTATGHATGGQSGVIRQTSGTASGHSVQTAN